ncbi:chorismate-binding protein [Winogradskyella sp. PG-2]|uniref:chorismate-binding protein n=1 Tax=Winogradskyella sp. PG-2 TaxID=754409 RepID=UPI0004587E98|nr:chorismate-binding protein [Winogradskyella sp. PG-2]BAO77607.1 isochorismate synthase [Winogradskyella sp. PG-2]
MNLDSFFEALETQYASQLPFVVYSRPINSIIKCWLQEDDSLYTTESFSESGFVFAPFDLKEESILLPKNHCQHNTLEVSELNLEDDKSCLSINNIGKEDHLALVSKGIETIKNGDLEKVVLSRQVLKPSDSENPLKVFKRLFNTYKNAMVYCWYHPKVGLWLGATPELLFKVEGKQLTTISLAGTQPYAENKDVSWTNKEYEEQKIVTDYIVTQVEPYSNQINISEVGTAKAGNLLHLKTYIRSQIKDSVNLKSVIEALHPTPAVCGFPKQKAKKFILSNENYNREYYTGFLGELNLTQYKTRNTNRRNVENNAYAAVKTQSNFYVNLRCMQLKDSTAFIYVGGGITKDSKPEKEWEETVNKTKTIGNVLY